ncbi:MAG: glycine betaine ABC transporter substrate-binding protein [Propionibacteriaceae bacterium]
MKRRIKGLRASLVSLALVVSVGGCGLGTAGGFIPSGQLAGPLEDVETFEGTKIAVGSKNFTEQLLLGKMTAILFKSAGAEVSDLTNIPGSASARQAQLDGQIDLMWEYTGTAWISYLGESDPIPDEQKQYEAVRDKDLEENGMVWLPPAPMNNTYGFAAKSEVAEELGTEKLSDLTKLDTEDLTFCIESEFASRNDGFRPMLEAYGLKYGTDVPEGNVKILDTGAIYEATDQGECNFGEVFTTDGRIKALDLAVLEDDKKFFPRYNVTTVISEDFVKANPQTEDLLAPVIAVLDDETLIELNSRIDVDGEDHTAVAEDWLRQEGFIS